MNFEEKYQQLCEYSSCLDDHKFFQQTIDRFKSKNIDKLVNNNNLPIIEFYLKNITHGEIDDRKSSDQYIEKLLDCLERSVDLCPPSNAIEGKIFNLLKAIMYIDLKSIKHPFQITIDYIKKLHRIIYGHDSDFRVVDVKPVGSERNYLSFRVIEKNIISLLNWYNQKITENHQIDMFVLGTIFFSEFLYIHPFIDGNGRLARLLLSLILSSSTVVPLHLLENGLLDALEKRMSDRVKPPIDLYKLILRSSNEMIIETIYLYDLN